MKLKGKKIEGPAVETIVLPREGGDIVFKCQAVLDYEECDAVLKVPKPQIIFLRGATVGTPDLEDADYKKALQEYGYKKFCWMVLKSLEATPELEWETVKKSDPSTWGNMEGELKAAGFSPPEIGHIFQAITSANGMSEEKIKEARTRFFDTVKQQEAS